MTSMLIRGFICTAMLLGLPLAGVLAFHGDLKPYLEFPPLTRHVTHAPFNLTAFAIISALDLLMLAGMAMLMHRGRSRSAALPPEKIPVATFPYWGITGIAVMLAGWLLAWTRFTWFQPFQPYTFCLPWVGYILLVNAICFRRSGQCLMTDSPTRFLLLWPTSALFWWFFEYLNRFVQNWYYVGGVNDFSAAAYIFHASLAFATVLPAVLSTQRLLLTYPIFNQRLRDTLPIVLPYGKTVSISILIIAALGLALIGPFSDHLYPLVWAAPLLVITALQALWDRPTLFGDIGAGDWRSVITAAVAALICGFFWELWNFKSLARWEYSVPFVNTLHIFEMPLLGYGGYLPFGLECLLVGKWVLKRRDLLPD